MTAEETELGMAGSLGSVSLLDTFRVSVRRSIMRSNS
jgi:hypothetical protein